MPPCPSCRFGTHYASFNGEPGRFGTAGRAPVPPGSCRRLSATASRTAALNLATPEIVVFQAEGELCRLRPLFILTCKRLQQSEMHLNSARDASFSDIMIPSGDAGILSSADA